MRGFAAVGKGRPGDGACAGGARTSVDAVIETLRQRITQLREVQEEVSRLG